MRSLALAAMAGPVDNPEERSGVLGAARSGDLPAFELLMRQYERLVLVTALRLAGNLPDAQDVSQEVFLKLYRNLGKVASEDAAVPGHGERVPRSASAAPAGGSTHAGVDSPGAGSGADGAGGSPARSAGRSARPAEGAAHDQAPDGRPEYCHLLDCRLVQGE